MAEKRSTVGNAAVERVRRCVKNYNGEAARVYQAAKKTNGVLKRYVYAKRDEIPALRGHLSARTRRPRQF